MPPNEPQIVIKSQAEAAAVAELVRRHIEAEVVEIGRGDAKATVLVLPDGLKAHSIKPLLDEYLSRPERRKGTAYFGELASFIEHTNRFKDTDSALFAQPDPAKPALTGVLDYHRAGAAGDPRFGQHRSVYPFPVSEEWKTWTAKDGEPMDQAAFAAFIEDRIADVADPGEAGETAKAFASKIGASFAQPTRLLELSRGLSVRVGQQVRNAQNLSTGEAQVQFVEQHSDEAGQPLKVPGAFLIAIPVFQFGAFYQVAARLRYRVQGGGIGWFYDLYRTERIFDHAFKEACDAAKAQTALPLFIGSPET